MSHDNNILTIATELSELLQEAMARVDVLSLDEKDDELIERCDILLDRFWDITRGGKDE